jgi:hypothetical protein
MARPKDYPSIVNVTRFIRAYLAENEWPHDFNVWASFRNNHFTVMDMFNLVQYCEDLYLVRLTDEDVKWLSTPVQLINRIQFRILEPPPTKRKK